MAQDAAPQPKPLTAKELLASYRKAFQHPDITAQVATFKELSKDEAVELLFLMWLANRNASMVMQDDIYGLANIMLGPPPPPNGAGQQPSAA
jgi:hypothetical protein